MQSLPGNWVHPQSARYRLCFKLLQESKRLTYLMQATTKRSTASQTRPLSLSAGSLIHLLPRSSHTQLLSLSSVVRQERRVSLPLTRDSGSIPSRPSFSGAVGIIRLVLTISPRLYCGLSLIPSVVGHSLPQSHGQGLIDGLTSQGFPVSKFPRSFLRRMTRNSAIGLTSPSGLAHYLTALAAISPLFASF